MEKVNLLLVYQLGLKLNALATMTYEKSKRVDSLLEGLRVLISMMLFFDEFPSLTVCRTKESELRDATDEAGKWLDKTDSSKWEEADKNADVIF